MRRGRDSNPRSSYDDIRFPSERTRPLCDLSMSFLVYRIISSNPIPIHKCEGKDKKIENTNKVANPISWEAIIDALVDATVSPKEHLVVSKTALDTFRYLVSEFQTLSPEPTMDHPQTVLDFDKAATYWRTNKAAILHRLAR